MSKPEQIQIRANLHKASAPSGIVCPTSMPHQHYLFWLPQNDVGVTPAVAEQQRKELLHLGKKDTKLWYFFLCEEFRDFDGHEANGKYVFAEKMDLVGDEKEKRFMECCEDTNESDPQYTMSIRRRINDLRH